MYLKHARYLYMFFCKIGTPVEKEHHFHAYSVGHLGADQVRIFAKSVPDGV
jgi:hypothetical protein